MYALTKRSGPFPIRPHFCVVPNVSWGLMRWEADLCVVTKAGRLWEIEIKVSASDWKIDAEKDKWRFLKDGPAMMPSYAFPSRFYYAAPLPLAERFQEFGTPDFAGVVGVNRAECGDLRAKIIREPKPIGGTKLTESQMMQVARLGSMRFWSENHKRIQREFKRVST